MNKSKYNSWEIFLSDLLKAKKARNEPINPWLRSIELAFGPSIFAAIVGGVGAGITSTALTATVTAGLGALLGPIALPALALGGAALLIKNKKMKTDETVAKLKKSKIVYNEILSSEMNDEEKNEAIDELFDDLLENRQIIY